VGASFEESCGRFREFLVSNGYLRDLVWISSDDVLLSGRRVFYVRLPEPDRARDVARARYELAMKDQSSVSFKALCETDHRTLCTVWVPGDDSECERALCSKTELKMSVPAGASRIRAKEVRSRIMWSYLRLRYPGKQAGKDFLFWG